MFVGLSYCANLPSIFHKNRADGTLSWTMIIIFSPYLFPIWSIWFMRGLSKREPCHQRIVDGLYLGRFCNKNNTFPQDVGFVVDLTAEFSACKTILVGKKYRCVPCLDAMYPPEERDLVELMIEMIDWNTKSGGSIYVHCAAGHGRSFMTVVIYMVLKEYSTTVDDAVRYVQSIRPKVHLHPEQRDLACRVVSEIRMLSQKHCAY